MTAESPTPQETSTPASEKISSAPASEKISNGQFAQEIPDGIIVANPSPVTQDTRPKHSTLAVTALIITSFMSMFLVALDRTIVTTV